MTSGIFETTVPSPEPLSGGGSDGARAVTTLRLAAVSYCEGE